MLSLGSVLEPAQFGVLVNGVGEGVEGTFSQSAGDTRLGGGSIGLLKGRKALQRDLDPWSENKPWKGYPLKTRMFAAEVVSKIKNKDLKILAPVCLP